MGTKTLFFIEARTGCSCCRENNHIRGPYKFKKDAEKRINYYLSKDSKYWPIGSQFYPQGSYHVLAEEVEEISRDRWIIWDRVFTSTGFIDVQEDGSLKTKEENDAEEFSEMWVTVT